MDTLDLVPKNTKTLTLIRRGEPVSPTRNVSTRTRGRHVGRGMLRWMTAFEVEYNTWVGYAGLSSGTLDTQSSALLGYF